jgi:hypothetical protein
MLYTGVVHADRGEFATRSAPDSRSLLKILLAAHCELTEIAADQAQQLRAVLLRGDNRDRALGRSGLSHGVLSTLAYRNLPHGATDRQISRHGEVQRLAQVVIAYRNELAENRDHMATVVNDLAPGITGQAGIGPFKAAKAILDLT